MNTQWTHTSTGLVSYSIILLELEDDAALCWWIEATAVVHPVSSYQCSVCLYLICYTSQISVCHPGITCRKYSVLFWGGTITDIFNSAGSFINAACFISTSRLFYHLQDYFNIQTFSLYPVRAQTFSLCWHGSTAALTSVRAEPGDVQDHGQMFQDICPQSAGDFKDYLMYSDCKPHRSQIYH